MFPLKYLSDFLRKSEMSLINYKINLSSKLSKKRILVIGTAANEVPEFKITDTKLYVTVLILLTKDNVKLLKQLEFGFKRTITIIRNKYQSKNKNQEQNRYLDF